MLKNKKFALLFTSLMAGLCITAMAVVTPNKTDFIDYCSGPNNSNCVFQIDASGNVTANNVTAQGATTNTGATTFNGTTTQTGKLIYTQQQAVQLSSFSVITPTSVFIIVSSTGNQINMAGSGSNNVPVISTTTATNGQYIVLTSTSNGTNGDVVISSGTNAGLDLGSATRNLANGKTLGLIYNSLISEWVELFYGNN